MIHPPNQTVTAKEGESLNIVVEFCAEPRHTKILWISEENVYVPGAEARDGVQALAIEVCFFFYSSFISRFLYSFSQFSIYSILFYAKIEQEIVLKIFLNSLGRTLIVFACKLFF